MGKDPNDPAALLDQLMGSARNLTDDQKAVVKPPWETSDCCPHFLAGCCPNFMFSYAQKRSDLPTCAYAVHDDAIALDYRRANLPTLPKYEQRLLDKLRILVDGMDERIAKAVARVKAEMVVSDPRTVTAIAELSAKIAALVAAAEKAGDDGDVETAEKAMAEADELAKLKKTVGGAPERERSHKRSRRQGDRDHVRRARSLRRVLQHHEREGRAELRAAQGRADAHGVDEDQRDA